MDNSLISNLRNIGISAHIDAGKTTTTERILFFSGVNHKIGEVHKGEATMDWMDQEQERGITINSAATTIFWNSDDGLKYQVNIIDTPGHVDFTIEVERSMRIIDGACMIYCSVAGVQSQSESVWRQSIKYNISKLIFINKMDREGSDYYKIYNDLKIKLGANPVPIFIPYFLNDNFIGVIDLINFKLILWDDYKKGFEYIYKDIPKNYLTLSSFWRDKLIESSIENDDFLINKFFNDELFNFEIYLSLRSKTIRCEIQPMTCGSSFKNKGIQCLLECVTRFLPSPLDIKILGFNYNDEKILIKPQDSKFLALAFKFVNDIFIGNLIFFRVYSGTLNSGDLILNPISKKKEKISRILRIHANQKEDINFISAGDIAAAAGLKNFRTGDTMCSPDNLITLDSITFPEPVISQCLVIKNKLEEDKVLIALNKLSFEDPSFRFCVDNNTKQIIIKGMGELHLEVTVEKIKREYNLNIYSEKPRVSYKETIKKSSHHIEGKYIRQSGGRGQYGHVIIDVIPGERGSGFKFFNKIKSGSIPKEYISCIEKSFEESLNAGILKGFPVTDINILLIDGSYHDVDSSENAFKIAANIALKEGLKVSNSIILEPIMELYVETPEEYVGNVLSDISVKRGNLLSMHDSFNNYKILKCNVPLSEMFNYSTNLRSMTKGRGTYNMVFSFYCEIPAGIIKNII
ncbi:putative translation elongation factor G [Candidatus Nasuia deltocephalinicola str. NAS-ALF]|uniref:Elongation factor G n=1 Tax=Candidatus Nasuia deltocephalinicola str. NAS-ALF TaxID=1343077 RepID=S5SQ03_9PROT|nr:putative translation elongation factor G [Candidatus Nasuia deltocephalinicola str. NAS-ALF]